MVIVFIILWVTAILVIYANPKTVWAWWIFSYLFLNGFGCISAIISDNILPLIDNTHYPKLTFTLVFLQALAESLEHYLSAYAFLGSMLYFTNFLNIKTNIITRHIILVVFAIPSILLFIFYPASQYYNPNSMVISVYVVIYTLLAAVILIISIYKENDSAKKNQKILTFILSIPTYLTVTCTSYISVAFGYKDLWYTNLWVTVCAFSIFIFLAFKCGILGVRLRLERADTDETIDAVISGINAVSHVVKNEVSTINLCADIIRNSQELNFNADKKITIIKESCRNLSDFTERINKCRVLEMDIKPFPLSVLVEKAINHVTPIICEKRIKITDRTNFDVTMHIDVMHISEVLKNILINAIEATPGEGIIEIQTGFIKDKFYLSVIDNGLGISKEAAEKIFTPFYSTKKGKNNYGLGLSYCYKVMKCHNGCLKVKSTINEGTTVSLLFPVETIQSISKKSHANINYMDISR